MQCGRACACVVAYLRESGRVSVFDDVVLPTTSKHAAHARAHSKRVEAKRRCSRTEGAQHACPTWLVVDRDDRLISIARRVYARQRQATPGTHAHARSHQALTLPIADGLLGMYCGGLVCVVQVLCTSTSTSRVDRDVLD